MLPPKAKFVREIERGRHDKTARPFPAPFRTRHGPPPAPKPHYTFGAPPPPDTTYFARVLRRCRHDDHNDDSDPYAPTLPIYEKDSDTASLFTVRRGGVYTQRRGSRGYAGAGRWSLSSYGSFDVARYRRDLAAATARRRRWLTFLAFALAGLVLIFGAGVLAFVLMSAPRGE
ncbi:hypothetical protein QIS74_09148 [Colletotrichum tabaci]|uniref:Uncharacterized protein n=1 Tax=Colletotrichum tabaci TaxID=1209068 RepID=A0AAV9T3R3_9PEZI